MNKKFFIVWAAVFVVWMAGSFVVHGWWRMDSYAAMSSMMR